MPMLLLTGPEDSGKTSLVTMFVGISSNAWLFDSLMPNPDDGPGWSVPETTNCDAVVFDHVCSLGNVAEHVAAAQAWCDRHGKWLCLVDRAREDLELAGIQLPTNVVELHLGRSRGVVFKQGDASRELKVPDLLALLQVVAPATSSKKKSQPRQRGGSGASEVRQ